MKNQNYQHLDEGGKPIKAWVNGVQLEDEARQQLARTSRLPFIYKHVAAMPDVHYGIGATVGSVVATKGAIVPAALGVDIGCFSPDTKVPLLDGSQKTLFELYESGGEYWVYSINKQGRIVPGLATAHKTREDADLLKVTVSGGAEIFCTPDHKFMLIDRTYKEAKDLAFNDSLMPLYRSWQKRDGYERCNNGKGTSSLTHKMVYRHFHGDIPEKHVVHHINHNHFDNRPENLMLMEACEHSAYHRRVGHSFDNSDKHFQTLRMAGIKRRKEDPDKSKKMKEVGTQNIKKYMEERPEHFRESTKGNGKRGAKYWKEFNTSPRECDDCGEILSNPASLRWHKNSEHGYNHKVVSVEQPGLKDDVYCLQVKEHYNFALSAGVFVHNCGMVAYKLQGIDASDLPDSLREIRADIEAEIPVGHNHHQLGSKHCWPYKYAHDFLKWVGEKHPGIIKSKFGEDVVHMQLGTLGGGNHFIELCLDENDGVWAMLHSGSRGIGNQIGRYFIDKAREDMRIHHINLEDRELAYLSEGTQHFGDYCFAVKWAQDYAKNNRFKMLDLMLTVLKKHLPKFKTADMGTDNVEFAVNCHHNYVEMENHFGENVLVTRKGAVRAREGDLGIIPGSMGARSFIVRGLGNPDSFHSCSHGAGRVMSRTKAKKLISLDDHKKATEGVECRKDKDVLDESPSAYKSIDAVMDAQKDLVEIVHTLKQVVCVKG